MKSTSGQFLGRYELLLPIAKGGMAEVWAARLRGSRGFQKIVAIKTIRAGTVDDGRSEQMFLDEATLASEIHHPNVVATIELGEHEGTLYHVMEWIEGESLNNLMKLTGEAGGVPLPIAVNLMAQACKGLQAAHDLRDESGALLGVVHRDISPHNLLVTASGTTKIADFGIATFTGRGTELTQQGELKGKFAYMAPEQISSGPIDRRTDIFAMGTVLYLLSTGRHPFKEESPVTTLRNVALKNPTPPSTIVEGYPLELEQVVLRALSKDPAARFASANEMLAALEMAMPQCHDGSFQIQVAEFMKRHFGDRFRERRAQLKAAQESADRNLPPDSSRGSASAISAASLRAVSVDGTGQGSGSKPIDVTLASPGASHRAPQIDAVPQPPPAKKGLRWLVVGGVGGAAIALLPFASRLSSTAMREPPGQNVATAAPAAPPAVTAVAPSIPTALAPAPTGSTTSPTANRSAQERPDDEVRARKESSATQRAAPAAAKSSRPTAHPKSSQPESPAAPAAAPAPAPSPERPSGPDLWDRRY